MSNKNQSIADLVLSLTPKEKQYFKSLYKGDYDFIVMFDFINKHKIYDADKIKSRIERSKPKTPTRKISSGHLAVIKRYLKDKILESLRIQLSNKKRPFGPWIDSITIDILIERGLYEMANQKLKSTKELYFENSFPIEQLILLRRESFLNFYTSYSNASLEDIEKLCRDREKAAFEMQLEVKMANALTMLSYLQKKGINDLSKIHQFFPKDYSFENFENLSFAPKYLYFWTRALISTHEGEMEEALNYFKESIRVWRENPMFIQAYPKMYLGTCFTYLEIYQNKGGTDPQVLKDDDFEVLLKHLDKVTLNTALKQQYRRLFLLNQLDVLVKDYEFKKAIGLEKVIEEVMKDRTVVSDYEQMFFTLFIAYSLFKTGKLNKALNWLTPYLEEKNSNRQELSEFNTRSFCLYLMIHFDLKNIRFLQYEIKKIKNALVKEEDWGRFEEIFFKMMSRLVGKRYEQKQITVFQNCLKELESFQKNASPIQKCNCEHLTSWIQRHVSNLEIAEG